MGEGEDERPPNFDEILEMTGLDPDQVSTSNIWELSSIYLGLQFFTHWALLEPFECL